MKEINNRADIELLVNQFYKKVINDDQIGYFFHTVIKLDWGKHIPIMYDFWETTLLGIPKYKGNPIQAHININNKEILTAEHFQRWLELWEETITETFEGKKANDAIKKAIQIAELMKLKIK